MKQLTKKERTALLKRLQNVIDIEYATVSRLLGVINEMPAVCADLQADYDLSTPVTPAALDAVFRAAGYTDPAGKVLAPAEVRTALRTADDGKVGTWDAKGWHSLYVHEVRGISYAALRTPRALLCALDLAVYGLDDARKRAADKTAHTIDMLATATICTEVVSRGTSGTDSVTTCSHPAIAISNIATDYEPISAVVAEAAAARKKIEDERAARAAARAARIVAITAAAEEEVDARAAAARVQDLAGYLARRGNAAGAAALIGRLAGLQEEARRAAARRAAAVDGAQASEMQEVPSAAFIGGGTRRRWHADKVRRAAAARAARGKEAQARKRKIAAKVA